MRDNPQFFHTGLGDKHPIEGITVYIGQTTGCYGMSQPDR